ncbi:RCC1/BLIP-II [Annulohypoxylon maeteangense]|uniref:RCC1/BLIP-II n=1 Tax=Annulohypoxylon maeteangense TaxID=1927788 RepID=UPI002008BB13|nr:RCC1/BLIP-II [Annulohypoxylon maeteangense]KAI0886736.1 RCC1/BLIP-II [Annulohypoxylon maeteangense]
MASRQVSLRHASLICRPLNPMRPALRQWPRFINTSKTDYAARRRSRDAQKSFNWKSFALFIALATGGSVAVFAFRDQSPSKPREATIEYEKARPIPESKEDNRDIISSQHLQVKKSWEHPGVYAWGANSGGVAAPDSTDQSVKTPRRIPYFDGQLLRDIKLDRDFGAALTENGDLVQWGAAFSKDRKPTKTLKGKDLIKIEISRDRIIALRRGGDVYSVPVAESDQTIGAKSQQSSWLSFWSRPEKIHYRQLKPQNLGWDERIIDISSGLDHALLLTSKGRVFSSASSTSNFPSLGQMGIPGLSWATRPKGAYDEPQEILGLKGFKITKVATGDSHSLALDTDGRVFVFGDNTSGQLGFEVEPQIPFVDAPVPLPFNKIYSGSGRKPQVTSISAGGANSFFTVDAKRIAGLGEDPESIKDLGRITADTWACGSGIWGSLGTGKWTHVSLGPTKIKPLSGLYEWDENTNSSIPIRLARLSAGSSHAAAVMDNVTSVNISNSNTDNETNWGADVVFWGGNEHYQLGTGKRNNIPTPTYIEPLDGGEGDAAKGRKGEHHRFQITPRTTVRLGEGGKGRKISVEQRVECGRFVTAVYSGT